MATIYAKIENVDGPVTTSGYEGFIQIDTVEFGVSRADPTMDGATTRMGVSLNQVTVSKKYDHTAVDLLAAINQNTSFKLEFKYVSTGTEQRTYLSQIFYDCYLTNVEFSSQTENEPLITFSFSYQKCDFSDQTESKMYVFMRPRRG
jgi:hypothetical protein